MEHYFVGILSQQHRVDVHGHVEVDLGHVDVDIVNDVWNDEVLRAYRVVEAFEIENVLFVQWNVLDFRFLWFKRRKRSICLKKNIVIQQSSPFCVGFAIVVPKKGS